MSSKKIMIPVMLILIFSVLYSPLHLQAKKSSKIMKKAEKIVKNCDKKSSLKNRAKCEKKFLTLYNKWDNRFLRDDMIKLLDPVKWEGVLREIVKKEIWMPGKIAALIKLKDETNLKKIVSNPKVLFSYRAMALRSINDQKYFIYVAQKFSNCTLKSIAVSRISGQSSLRGLSKNQKCVGVRAEIVKKLNDKRILRNYALSDTAASIRIAAMKKLNDQEILRKIAWKDKSEIVRTEALLLLDVNKYRKFLEVERDLWKNRAAKIKLMVSELWLWLKFKGKLSMDYKISYSKRKKYIGSKGKVYYAKRESVTITIYNKEKVQLFRKTYHARPLSNNERFSKSLKGRTKIIKAVINFKEIDDFLRK